MTDLAARARPRLTYPGHVVGASFGLVLLLVNSASLGGGGRTALGVVAVAAFLAVVVAFVATMRRLTTADRRALGGFGRRYWAIVAVEVVALFGGLAVLNRVEPAAALGWIALVVGLHFLPMARIWPVGGHEFWVIGVAMAVLGVVGLVLAFTGARADLVALVSGVGSGVVLLGWALLVAVGTLRGVRTGSPAG